MVPSRLGGVTPHSWVEAHEDGKIWVYDPNRTNETGVQAFKVYYGMPGTWRYQDNKTMTIEHK